eukprot:10214978-Karenia_brevis.AAC.1
MDTEPLPTVKERAAVFETSGSGPVQPNRAWNAAIISDDRTPVEWIADSGAGRLMITNTSASFDVPITDPRAWICAVCVPAVRAQGDWLATSHRR